MPKPINECHTGVYCLRCVVNDKRYVGSGAGRKGILGRVRGHREELSKGTHYNRYLQAAWNKYGAKNFRFSILERCPPERCLEREQYWIDFYRSAEREFGYNLAPKAGNTLGVKFSEESRKRVSASARNRPPVSEETKQKISQAGMGKKPTEGTRKKLVAAAQARREQTRETSRTLYEARSDEVLARMREACAASNRERVWTQEMRDKVSRSLTGRKRSPESRRKQSLTSKSRGWKMSEDAKQKISEAKRRYWANWRQQSGG